MRKHLWVLLAYSLLALLLTWPLALHFGTHVVGDGSDDPALTWNLWWFKHAVLDLQTTPLQSDFMFYPIGINLVFYTLTLLNDALALPLLATMGLVPAANLLLLSSFVLSGYGMFLLARHLLARLNVPHDTTALTAAFAAGLVYAFSSDKLLYASLGQYNIASSQWIPFYVLYLFRLRAAPRAWHSALLAAVFLLLQAYAEFTFASFLLVFTFFFTLGNLRPLARFWPLARRLSLVALLFVVGFAPILLPMLAEMRVEGDFLVQGSGFAEAFSADLLGFVVPSRLHPLLGSMDGWFQFPYINFMFVGWLTLALAIVGAWRYRRHVLAKFWTVTTLTFVLFALGPALRINGQEIAIPLPFTIFQWLPFFKGNRYPSRYAVLVTLGVAVLASFALHSVLAQWARRQTGARWRLAPLALSLVLLFEHLAVPLPLSDYRVPSFYHDIRDEAGEFTVLELPLAWRNGFRITGTPDKVFMLSQFYQTAHEKRMLSGNTSRNPELKFQYFTEAPVINSLIALETGHDLDAPTLAQDKLLASEVMRFFGVRYIVLRPEAGDKLRPYLESVLPDLKLWREDNGVRVYRLEPLPPSALALTPQSPLARLYFAEGWGELGETRVWAQRNETRLLLPQQDADSVLTLRLTMPAAGQKVSVSVNGSLVGALDALQGTHDYQWRLSRARMRYESNELVLRWENLYETRGLPSEFGRPMPRNRFVVVKSAGEEVGDFAHIWIDGIDLAPNRRGYNYVRFQPLIESNEPFAFHFDTFDSAQASNNLASRLKSESWSIALAARDEVSRYLTPELYDALKARGVHVKVGWRWSHAFIRYGAGPDLIIREDASPIRPAIVSVGERITSPFVAGALESIEIRSAERAP